MNGQASVERCVRAFIACLERAREWEGRDWEVFVLRQGDPRWGDHVYAGGGCFPLASQGCWIACVAMALRVLGLDAEATPLSVDEAVGAEGYYRCLFRWDAMVPLGLRVVSSTRFASHARGHLDEGGVVFVEVEPSSLMHFVLGVEYEGDDFLVLDPWKGVVGWLGELYGGAETFRLVECV